MAYSKISQPKISDVIMNQLEQMILEGSLKPGQKLPPERELALQFEVSRPSLREAIQKLEAKGLLLRRQGGGTYVKQQLWQSMADPIVELMQNDRESQYDLLEFRHATEGMMAYFAALRGTDTDMQNLQDCIMRVEKSTGIIEQASAIVDFYRTVAEASHNMAMLHLVLSLTSVLHKNVAENLELLSRREEATHKANEHRRALLAAIVRRDPEAAREASNDHLSYIEEVMLSVREEDSRLQRSLRRMKSGV
ncbi:MULTISPECIES: pyruvate dehydrogenase complex transcriptional repressor PdhR [Shewanella]|jgi:GntR family transcriptional repressor for pyruvate dehydrogenase complex|uniref:Pyruvate dehydrogenase complex repressor n=1 Tax=Shewanella fodinae TaxID=552357 RepID=A0A4R2FHY6_9GAMM|nr:MULTISPECIES: pyruvate dehydrogenase complex transcriptional repressor PdhR [Shewanella]MDN5369054.1 GntR family transcriptional regulator, transcriptional repressor for pyruvate dehydrogenase complex [Shewanella sp.]MBO1271646.1 pyruvate dehydrogenase complex transcriptional repressor PdhR [Shewanella sp. 4t3-1-2LB]MCL2907744.1 pyruvate dehydrogenase complex transcriptional repressor PdhR [Shewanella fodinae]TCN90777.1 GntR family transcriptional regulator [Shewanella fodinae]GGZ10024.1 tr